MSIKELFQQGDLQACLDATAEAVRNAPSDGEARFRFAELLCFNGQYERADKQLNAIQSADVTVVATINTFRRVLRAEYARTSFFEQGSLPEFVSPPDDILKEYLDASIDLRSGNPSGAKAKIDEACGRVPQVCGTVNGQEFTGVRDLDDLIAPVLEVFTENGNYLWMGFDQIRSMTFKPPGNLFSLLWRTAKLEMCDDTVADVCFVPTRYVLSGQSDDIAVRLGRATNWSQDEAAPIRGVGQKVLQFGENAIPLLELKEVHISEGK